MGIVVLKRLAEALMDDDNLLTQAFRLHTQKTGFNGFSKKNIGH
jgi:hypothetical protein